MNANFSYSDLKNSMTSQDYGNYETYSFCNGHITASKKGDKKIKVSFGSVVPVISQDRIEQDVRAIISERVNHVAQQVYGLPHNDFNIANITLPTKTMSDKYVHWEKNSDYHPNATEVKKLIKKGNSEHNAKRKASPVVYFNESEQKKHKVTIAADGKLQLPNELKKKEKLIYVMDKNGKIFVADDKKKIDNKKIKHSSLLAGDAVACAGKIKLSKDGRIKKMDNNSGHYEPTKQHLNNSKTALKIQGIDVTKIKFKDKSK